MSTVGELLVRIGVDAKGLTAGMAAARREIGSLGGASGSAAATVEKDAGRIQGSFTSMGGAIAKVGLIAGAAAAVGIAALGIESAKAANRFNADMLLIQTQAGASAQEVTDMSKAVLNLAPTVGVGPDALAAGLYHVESAGFRGATALDVLTTAAKGAAVGHADLESVTNALIAEVNSGVKGVGNMSNAMGVLNGIVGAGNMRMQDLTDAFSTGILSSAKTFGVSIQSVGAAIADMTNQGIPAVDAATKLNSAIRLMAAPTKVAAKDLASIGLSSTQLATDMRSPGGVMTAIADLKKHLEGSGLSATKQAALLASAFGGKQSGGILTLVGSLDKLKVIQDSVNKSAGGFGAAWEATQSDVAQQQAQIGAKVAALTIKIGDVFVKIEQVVLPIVNNIIGGVSDLVDATMNWISANQPLINQIGSLISTALAPLGAAINLISSNMDIVGPIIGGIVVLALYALASAAAAATIAAAPLVLAFIAAAAPIIAIVAAVGAVVYVITHWTQVTQALGPIIQAVMTAVSGAIGTAVAWIVARFTDLVNFVVAIPARVASWVGGIVGQAQRLAAQVASNVSGFVAKVVAFILGIPGRIIGWIAGIVGQAARIGGQVIAAFTGFVGTVVSTILSIPGRIIGWIGSLVGQAGQIVSGIIGAIVGIPGAFARAGADAVGAFMGFIVGLPGKVAGVIGDIAGSIGGFLGGLIPHFAAGAWNLPQDMLAVVHRGEMIVPAQAADPLRRGVTGGVGAFGSARTAASSPRASGGATSDAGAFDRLAAAILTAIRQQRPLVGELTVNNPKPEPASTSTGRELQKLAAFGYAS